MDQQKITITQLEKKNREIEKTKEEQDKKIIELQDAEAVQNASIARLQGQLGQIQTERDTLREQLDQEQEKNQSAVEKAASLQTQMDAFD